VCVGGLLGGHPTLFCLKTHNEIALKIEYIIIAQQVFAHTLRDTASGLRSISGATCGRGTKLEWL
jgi:hypothetical protein